MSDEIAVCVGKEAFDSAVLAHRVLKRRSRRDKAQRKTGDVYRCRHCGRWHIGRESKPIHGGV